MAMKNYTAEQKAAAIAKAEEIGITKAAKELSISATTLKPTFIFLIQTHYFAVDQHGIP